MAKRIKKWIGMVLMLVMVCSFSMSVLAAQESENSTDSVNLVPVPVQETMSDPEGNTYIVVGQCFEAGAPSMNVAGVDTICECYGYAHNDTAWKNYVHNKQKKLQIVGSGVLTATGELPIPDVTETKTGKIVNIRSQISNAPFFKIDIAGEHRVTIDGRIWIGHSYCNLF